MEFGEIFTDAIKYPISDYKKLLMVGVIFVLSSLVAILAGFGFYNDTFAMIWGIVAFLLSFLMLGYGLSVIKRSIDLDDEIPDFDWANNFVDGIKYFVVLFVYMIIPTIIVTIIGVTTSYGPLSKIFTESNMEKFAALGASPTANDIFGIVPQEVWNALFVSISITIIVAVILYIIFSIFEQIAICRLAKYDSLGEAFSFGEIFNDIKEIGILRIIAFLIVVAIISTIIALIIAIITAIPFIGLIIAPLVGSAYLLLFGSRALGLLYSDV